MSVVEGLIISKILDDKDFYSHRQFGVTVDDFTVLKDAYSYLEQFYSTNSNDSLSAEVIEEKFTEFEYTPNVESSYKALSKELRQYTAKRLLYDLLGSKVPKKFDTLDGDVFIDWISTEIATIANSTKVTANDCSDWANSGQERLDRYKHIKNGKIVMIPTPFETLTKHLEGGFDLGDYVLLEAYTNVGKSWIASLIGLTAWENSFNVLHYSPELSKHQQMERLDSLKGRFSASDIARGKVTEEQRLLQYYEQFKDNDTKYIVKTMENIDGTLDADLINSDLESYKGISMVIIDGFNLMAHKGSGSNRDKMSSTSRQLRRIFAKHNVVGIVVHQTPTSAKKENEAVDDLGDRIPSPAKIHQYSETIAVVQDACTVLSYDYSNGIGKILIAKARKPCVDDEIDLIVDYKNGYIVDKLHMASNMPLNF